MSTWILHGVSPREVVRPATDAIRFEDPQQVVFEREKELARTGIALATRSTAQLVVDATAFMALGAQNMEATSGQDGLLLRRALGFKMGQMRQVVGVFLVLTAF